LSLKAKIRSRKCGGESVEVKGKVGIDAKVKLTTMTNGRGETLKLDVGCNR
jgi:hypothetical protein